MAASTTYVCRTISTLLRKKTFIQLADFLDMNISVQNKKHKDLLDGYSFIFKVDKKDRLSTSRKLADKLPLLKGEQYKKLTETQ